MIKMVEGYSKSELEAKEDYQCSFEKIVSEPVVDFGRYGDYWLVGHGEVTNSECGVFKKFMGCLNAELHNAVRWYYPDLPKNAVFVKSVYHSCDNPLCPKCYKYGWAVREAGRIEARLKEASKRFGLIEHIVVSVPDNDCAMSLEDLRKKCVKVLSVRGVIGGCLIFHAFRYRNSLESRKRGLPIGWFWSPHFHVLGFIGGEGYGKCRNCAFNPEKVHNWDRCKGCNGFEGLTRRCYEKEGGRAGSGYIVRVLGKRKTVGGTAWYQLNHASVRRGVNSKKSHVATWFGVCSYRKLKLINGEDVGIKHKCPICGNDLVRVRYLGVFSEVSISRRGEIVSFYDDDGKPLWEIVAERKFKGG
jgi:hypothetical protein